MGLEPTISGDSGQSSTNTPQACWAHNLYRGFRPLSDCATSTGQKFEPKPQLRNLPLIIFVRTQTFLLRSIRLHTRAVTPRRVQSFLLVGVQKWASSKCAEKKAKPEAVVVVRQVKAQRSVPLPVILWCRPSPANRSQHRPRCGGVLQIGTVGLHSPYRGSHELNP